MSFRHGFSTGLKRIAIHGVLIVLGLTMVVPFFWMVVTSFKDPTEVLVFPPRWLPEIKTYATDPVSGTELRVMIVEEGASVTDGEVERPALPSGSPPGTVRVRSYEPGDTDRVWSVPLSDIRERRFLWGNYPEAWSEISREVTFTRYFYVTTLVAVLTTIGQLITSILAAYAFARIRFFLNHVMFTILLGTMMVPQPVLLIPNFIILAELGWLNSFKALIIPWTASVFGIFLLRQYFLTIPQDLLDAARIDGCGHLRIIWTIMIPLSKPILWTLALFSFIGSWNSFIWPLIVTNSPEMRTIQVGLASLQSEVGVQWTLLMAASTISLIPLIILFFIMQHHLIESFARSGLKG